MVSLNCEPRLATLFLFMLHVLHRKVWRKSLQSVASTWCSATRAAQEHSVVSRVEITMLNKNVSIAEWLVAGPPQLFLSYLWTCQESAKLHTGKALGYQWLLQEQWSFTDLFTCMQVFSFMCGVFSALCLPLIALVLSNNVVLHEILSYFRTSTG